MLCQQCCKREAQFHSYRIINNELTSVHLCERCIENKSSMEEPNGIDDKLHSILDVLLKKKVHEGNSMEGFRCESCGTTLDEYEKTGLLGCPRCYELFAETIFTERVNRPLSDPGQTGSSVGSDSRTKKKYSTDEDLDLSYGDSKFLQRLEIRLKKAVESEDFEEAANIRDRIKNLEKEGFFGDS